MKRFSFTEKLVLWGVDRPPSDPEMLLNFIQTLAENQSVPALTQSIEELDLRRDSLQKRLRQSLGLDPWPERTQLRVRKTGELKRDGYKIEKLVYEAWPGLLVTAHLYLPDFLKEPSAGLVYACGHWMEAGKLALPIQSFCASSASLGIITLVFDPIGQGERFGNWRGHRHLNALLVGKCQLGLMVWESIRALDYLLSRPEVDPKRIGMTGASGGGLNTFFTSAIEDRFACAIPVAYPCTFSAAMKAERDLNWEDGTDVCNQVPKVMSYAEMSDIASLFIPKPYMILSGIHDQIFPIAGTRQIATNISHNYGLAGVSENFRFVEFDEVHGYQQSLREAAYGWLKKWLLNSGDGSPISEPVLDLLPNPYPVEYSTPPFLTPDNLGGQSPTMTPTQGSLPGFCLPQHQDLHNEEVLSSMFRTVAKQMPSISPLPTRLADLSEWQGKVIQRVRKKLGSFPQKCLLQTRIFNQVWENGMMAERITFQSEEGITIPGLFIMPEEWNCPVPFVIYAGEWGKNQGIYSSLIEELVQDGYGVLAIDVRGIGETATSDFEAATNLLMMDRSLFGQRVMDVIRAIDFVWERCYIAPQIDKGRLVIIGDGVGGLWALYAAALDRRVAAVAAMDVLYSYTCLLDHGARFPASVYLFDVLKEFDLDHLIASIAPRPVYLRPVDGWRRPCTSSELDTSFRLAREAFSLTGACNEEFQVSSAGNMQSIFKWLHNILNN